MNEGKRESGGGGRERKKLFCKGWMHVNEFKKKKKKKEEEEEEKRKKVSNHLSLQWQSLENLSLSLSV